jgi:GWxTD domain-containing protein
MATRRYNMKRKFLLILLIILSLGVISCSVKSKFVSSRAGGKYDEFYEKTRMLMSKSELQIYRHLPDEAARLDFIEEFWKKRDPTPETEENESKMEFDRRIEYVDRWFRERVGYGRGWESDRGKIYLYLGPPDERYTYQEKSRDRLGLPLTVITEEWRYYEHRLHLRFSEVDGLGVFRLQQWDPDLLAAIEREKLLVYREDEARFPFKFKAAFNNNEIEIKVPVDAVSFDEKDERMTTQFKIAVYIYLNYEKIDTLETDRNIDESKEDLLTRKNIAFTVPFTPAAAGRYTLDIVVEETVSGARYRDMITFKY